ncbi:MAG: hypothetical protein QOH56_2709 [Pseudonocardiales bacterium]|nr:hypothetical protein [Pseudonocardiales bacterium]
MNPPRQRVLIGDAGQRLQEFPEASIDMVLASPPYFRLRDYGMTDQLGMESAISEWVVALRGVARQLRRVLTPTGSLWLNVGDSYATHPSQGGGRKSLLLGPERLAIALLTDGWLLRNKVVWQKSNAMPTSVRDRMACTWEALYVFVKQPNYFFELDAIRQPHASRLSKRQRITAAVRGRSPPEAWRGPNAGNARGLDRLKAAGRVGHPLGKNPGDVWRIASSNYRGGHHATFPIELARRAIRAGCPEARCQACGKPYRRPTIRHPDGTARRGDLLASCGCRAARAPGLVLDPFIGAGTTGVAAESLGRDWLGIELNPAFANLAEQRIQQARASPQTA